MAKKPEIQYVRQFYVYGSEARQSKEAPKKNKLLRPKLQVEKFQKIYVDPITLGGAVLAVVMLVFLVAGSVRMRDTRLQYEQMANLVSELKLENGVLSHEYHTGYDLSNIGDSADKIGMVKAEDAERFTVVFSVPTPEKEPTVWDEFVWLLSGLLANPRRS